MTTKIELGKTYKTRSGNSTYKVVCVDAPGEYPVIAYYVEDGNPEKFTEIGEYNLESSYQKGMDLVSEVVPKIVRYVNIYSEEWSNVCLKLDRQACEDEVDAEAPIACIRIEYSPGQFDE